MKKNSNQKEKKNVSVAGILTGAAAGTLATLFFMKKKNKEDCQKAYEIGFYKGYKGHEDNDAEAAAFYEKLAKKYAAEPIEAEVTETETAPESTETETAPTEPETAETKTAPESEPETV